MKAASSSAAGIWTDDSARAGAARHRAHAPDGDDLSRADRARRTCSSAGPCGGATRVGSTTALATPNARSEATASESSALEALGLVGVEPVADIPTQLLTSSEKAPRRAGLGACDGAGRPARRRARRGRPVGPALAARRGGPRIRRRAIRSYENRQKKKKKKKKKNTHTHTHTHTHTQDQAPPPHWLYQPI